MKCKNKIEIGDDYVKVYFKDGTFFLCDKEDLDYVNLRTWHRTKAGRGYAASRINNKTTYFHRLVLDANKGKDVDHINHNTLDNRKKNLREITHTENMWNREIHSVYGCGIYKDKGKYYNVQLNKKSLGSFKDLESAKKAREQAEKEYLKNKA